MIESLFKAGRQLVGGIAKTAASVVMVISVAAAAGAMMVYEGISYGLNYTGELVARARLGALEIKDRSEAKVALIAAAQKNGILPADKSLTKYQDCIIDEGASRYAFTMGQARTGEHVQRSEFFGKNIATFKTVRDFSSYYDISKHFKTNVWGVQRFGNCDALFDKSVDSALRSVRLRNIASSVSLKREFSTELQYRNVPNYELSKNSLERDLYAQIIVPALSSAGVSANNLDDVVTAVEYVDRMRGADQLSGRFYYSTQVRDLKANPAYSQLDEPQKATLASVLNFSANLPKHSSQIQEEERVVEQVRLMQVRQDRRNWEEAEITRVANEEWKLSSQNSPEIWEARRRLMTPISPETVAVITGNIEAERKKYEQAVALIPEKLQAIADSEYRLVRSGVERRLRQEWDQQTPPQAAPR